MAGYDLIDTYLRELAERLRWRRDVDELIDELGDHLWATVEGLELAGENVDDAQRAALDRFGSVECVATAVATTPLGGVALPTRFTRRAGLAAVMGAVAWPIVVVAWWLSEVVEQRAGRFDGGARVAYMVGGVALLAATGLTALVVLGLNRRHGGIGLAGVGAVICAFLAVGLSFFGWFVIGWALMTALAAGLAGVGAIRVHIAPRVSAASFAGAWTIAAVAWGVMRALEVGGPDRWGNYPVVDLAALTVGSALMAVGSLGLGRWLLAETPVEPAEDEAWAAT